MEGELANKHDHQHKILDSFSEKPNDYYDVKDSDVWPDQVQLSVEGELAHNHEHKILDSFNEKPNDYYDVKDSDVWPDQVQLEARHSHEHKILSAFDKEDGYYADVANLQTRSDPPPDIATKWTKDK